AAVDTHDVLLIAQAPVARRLKDQSLAVMTEIGLGILAPEGERADVAQVALPASRRDLARRRRFVRRYLMAPRGAGAESKGRHSRENGGPSGLRSTAEHARLHAPEFTTRRLAALCLSARHVRGFDRRDGEQFLLRRPLVEKIDRFAQRRVVREVTTLRRRIAEREARNTLLEQAIDVTCRRVVVFAIEDDALGLQATQQLVTPLRLDGEILVDALRQLERVVVIRRVEVLLLG